MGVHLRQAGVKARQSVLVVDDEPQLLVAMEDLLGDDYRVLTTSSGPAALEVVQTEPDVAVVLCDQRMPGMAGDEVLARLMERCDATRILVTGYADLTAVIRAVNDGNIFAYVSKPWSPDTLRITVDRAAQHCCLQRELAREKKLLSELIDSVPDGIYVADKKHRVVRSNRSYRDLWPKTHGGGEAPALPTNGLPSLGFDTKELERQVLKTGTPSRDVVRQVNRGGQLGWCSASHAALVDPEGRIDGVVGVLRDVTERLELNQALRVNEERLRLVIGAVGAGLFDWSIADERAVFSPQFLRLLGEESDDFVSNFSEFLDRIHPADQPRVRQRVAERLAPEHPREGVDCRVRCRDGGYRWFSFSAASVQDENGDERLVGAIRDIAERKEQEKSLLDLSRARNLQSEINSCIVRVRDKDTLLRKCCQIAVEHGDVPFAGLLIRSPGGLWETVASESEGDELGAPLEAHLLRIAARDEIQSRLTSAESITLSCEVPEDTSLSQLAVAGYGELAIFPISVSGSLQYAYVLLSRASHQFDSKKREAFEESANNIAFALEHAAKSVRLHFLTSYDEMTGLPRRELFVERIRQTLQARSPETSFTVAWFDVDRFRQINETFERSGGDQLLKQIAQRLNECTSDPLGVARLGPNAFGMVSSSSTKEAEFFEMLTECFRKPFLIGDAEVRVSITIGLCTPPAEGGDPDALVSHAETASKIAKTQGRAQLVFADSMSLRVPERVALENNLRRAYEEQEFLLHYQPKVNVKTGELSGLEALIRWQEPSGGLVPPGVFIPVLEETGLILQVGAWVLQEAARQLEHWRQAGYNPPRIAVNVSALQLADPLFGETLAEVFRRYPLASNGLDLEITESVVMGDFDANVRQLQGFREAGLRIAIDDFGTGYSSLGYLSRLPADALKIDRSFVDRMDRNPHDMSIVTTVITLAHALDLKVIAEGVETTDQARMLRLLKCDELQGYLVARPLPAEDVVLFLKDRTSLAHKLRPDG